MMSADMQKGDDYIWRRAILQRKNNGVHTRKIEQDDKRPVEQEMERSK